MNYNESAQILDLVNKAERILLNCHRNPDADCTGSSLSLKRVLESMGKEVKIIVPNEIPEELHFLEGVNQIEVSEFDSFDFDYYDLFILTDTSSWGRVFSSTEYNPPEIPVVVIDNHESNTRFGDINLVDFDTSSVAEMIYLILEDWDQEIDQTLATTLLAGMIGDTGCFQFEIYERTFEIANKLIKKGADHSNIIFNMYNSKPAELIVFWGKAIENLQVHEQEGFAYIAMNYEQYEPYHDLEGTKESLAGMFVRKIKDTEFGFVMIETSPGSYSISFRARTDVNVARIAEKIGGGGHPAASGAYIENMSYDSALEKVLNLCRDHAKSD